MVSSTPSLRVSPLSGRPFRKLRGVLILVAVLIGLQALTLTAGAEGALADVEVGVASRAFRYVLASAMVLLAIANLSIANLRRRCSFLPPWSARSVASP